VTAWNTAGVNTERELTPRDFPVHWPVLTRWTDNDMFGHLNNAVYYELFDTAINAWLGTAAGLDPVTAPWLGVVAESGCRYFAELQFPDPLVVGLAVTRLGTSSVTYRLAVFHPPAAADPAKPAEPAETVAAVGHWVHVYVDRVTRRPVPIPDAVRSVVETAVIT
jgi:acyl-CoA thioester hydrolase